MEFPVRCFTCGKIIGHLWGKYKERIGRGGDPGKVLDELGIKRYCCRRMFISYVDLAEEMVVFRRIV